MPAQQNSNKAARIIVPLLAVGLAVIVVLSTGSNNRGQQSTPSGGTAPSEQTPADTKSGPVADAGAPSPEQTPSSDPTPPPADPPTEPAAAGVADPAQAAAAAPADPAALPPLRARRFGPGLDLPPAATLGSLDPASGHELEVVLTPYGAGIASITATNHYVDAATRARAVREGGQVGGHYVIQRMEARSGVDLTYRMAPFAAVAAIVDGQRVELFGGSYGRVWEEIEPGVLEAIVETETGEPVLRIRRAFRVEPGSYDIAVEQSVENLSDRDVRLGWEQEGPIDLDADDTGYNIPLRRVRFGYTLDWQQGTTPRPVKADGKLQRMRDVAKQAQQPVWPQPDRYDYADRLVWIGQTNRYFAAVMHPLVDAPATDPALALAESVTPFLLALSPDPDLSEVPMVLRTRSGAVALAAGETAELDFGIYAGPLFDETMAASGDAVLAIDLPKIVAYNLGSLCAFCTFESLGRLLLAFLHLLHGFGIDWAISIIVMVLCVRTILHPVTKRSQVSVQRFGKQMQRIAPKQKKIQEKYKGDPKRMQAELQKLMREEGISYAGALGCLPMFLQMPIWVALYAMLYLAFELRHEPAFYGLFQMLSGGSWGFLSDLSSGDAFIPLPFELHIPLVSNFMGPISSINLLPLLLGVVFYVHQKYMTPPPSSSLTPEQATQQKMMKIMMVVLFPIMMYNAPSGLAIYFITNSTLGIFESRWIRAHVDKLELEKPPGKTPPRAKRVRNEARRSPRDEQRSRNRYKKR